MKEFNLEEEIAFRTRMQKYRFKEIVTLGNLFNRDPDNDERIKEQLCICCYYQSTIAGQAFTDSKCVNCNKEMTFSTTSVDKLCEDCAKANNVCKHCCADINYKDR